MGVPLLAFRCAYASKVGVLRANGAAPTRPPPGYGVKGVCGGFAPSLTACPPHASRSSF
ncbi:MAG: hypothetical protein RML94_11560 [Bacteroidia bacterium]|nr:hypothetical protein [Bacteroidia bacterium]